MIAQHPNTSRTCNFRLKSCPYFHIHVPHITRLDFTIKTLPTQNTFQSDHTNNMNFKYENDNALIKRITNIKHPNCIWFTKLWCHIFDCNTKYRSFIWSFPFSICIFFVDPVEYSIVFCYNEKMSYFVVVFFLYCKYRSTGSPLNSACAKKPEAMMSRLMVLVCCHHTVNCCMHWAANPNCVHSNQLRPPYKPIKIKNTSPSTMWPKASKMPKRNSVAGYRPCHDHSKCASIHTPNALKSWTRWTNLKHLSPKWTQNFYI